MKLIKIKDGLSINIDTIISVGELSDTQTTIVTTGGTYTADFPYTTFIAMLESEVTTIGQEGQTQEEKEEQEQRRQKEKKTIDMLQGWLKNVGTFAG
jgi:oligoribonuclease (3'-5' exoribonuclease)